MTVIGQDTAIRANQSGWGTASDGQVWSHVRGSSNWNVASNELTVDTNSGFYNVFTLGSNSYKDGELFVWYTPGASGDSGGFTMRHIDANNFYYCDIGNLGQFAEIGKDVATSFSTIASVAFSWTAGTTYGMRFRVIGTALALKVWAKGTAEPTGWTIDTTDSSHSAAAPFGIACDPIGAAAMKYDGFYAVDYANCENLSVTDSLLNSDTTVLVESNSASDSFTGSGSGVFSDGLSTSDSLLVQDSYSTTDNLSTLDIFLSQGGAQWAEIDTVSDAFSSGGSYLPVEGLSVSESLLASELYSPVDLLSVADMPSALQSWGVDALAVSDSFSTVTLFVPVEALSALDSLLASDQVSWADVLSITDSFTGTSSPPALNVIPVTFVLARGRDGLVVAYGRDGIVQASSRDGLVVGRGH